MDKRIGSRLTIVIIWIIVSVLLYYFIVVKDVNNENNTTDRFEEQSSIKNDKDDKIENWNKMIRVLLRTDNYEGQYHKSIKLSGTNGMELYDKNGILIQRYEAEAVSSISSEQLINNWIQVKPLNDGRIIIHDLKRHDEVSYRGILECYGTEQGIIIINELPVEQYLYGVVPSEMPENYPEEALKAQAISARTYVAYHITNYAYPEWKAHVDDSTAYQVYMNIRESELANKAVDETKGQVLTYEDNIIESFYYSTSSGYGAGAEAWNENSSKEYLMSKKMDVLQASTFDTTNMTDVSYKQFIDYGRSTDVEYNEPWYRWNYSRSFETKEDIKTFIDHIIDIQKQSPESVLVRAKGAKKINSLNKENKLTNIEVAQRFPGGLVNRLLISTENFDIEVISQYTIRQILAQKGGKVVKKDNSEYTIGNILPSAFFYIDADISHNVVKNIDIKGGGLGHGVGMSQNGAKNLARNGFECDNILKYYYNNIQIVKLW